MPETTDPTFHRIPADVIACPDPTCRAPARIVDRWTLGSTGGPVEHIKTGCERGHWFTPTVDSLDLEPVPPGPARRWRPSPERANRTHR